MAKKSKQKESQVLGLVLIGFLVVLIIILTSYAFGNFSNSSVTGNAVAGTSNCKDSDAGNLSIAGNATYLLNGVDLIVFDSCGENVAGYDYYSVKVMEHSCNKAGKLVSTLKTCKAGQRCEAGACVVINSCVDNITDGGLYIDGNKVQQDVCSSTPFAGYNNLFVKRNDYSCTTKNKPKASKNKPCAANQRCSDNGQCVVIQNCTKINNVLYIDGQAVQKDICDPSGFSISYTCNTNKRPVKTKTTCDSNYGICGFDNTAQNNSVCKEECMLGKTLYYDWGYAEKISTGYRLYNNCTANKRKTTEAICKNRSPLSINKSTCGNAESCFMYPEENPQCITTCTIGLMPDGRPYAQAVYNTSNIIYATNCSGSKVNNKCDNRWTRINIPDCLNGYPAKNQRTTTCEGLLTCEIGKTAYCEPGPSVARCVCVDTTRPCFY